MLDIDHFKMVNDGNGHLAGDQVLIAVAEQLKQHTRPYDLLGRFGGDEFVLLCIGVDTEDLIGIAERVRHSIERLTIPVEDQPVTMSIGAAHFPEVGPELEDLLLAADNALFAAKDRGRNRVVILRHRQAAGDQVSSGDSSN
jgi:diguanylate cyclase (GGDEF)-like protein